MFTPYNSKRIGELREAEGKTVHLARRERHPLSVKNASIHGSVLGRKILK
jgi:hypothetical protein